MAEQAIAQSEVISCCQLWETPLIISTYSQDNFQNEIFHSHFKICFPTGDNKCWTASKDSCFSRTACFLTLTLLSPFANSLFLLTSHLPPLIYSCSLHSMCTLLPYFHRFERIFSTSCQRSTSPAEFYLNISSAKLRGPSHSSLHKSILLHGSYDATSTCPIPPASTWPPPTTEPGWGQ